jgi:TP901 family phage tail tape measure protein
MANEDLGLKLTAEVSKYVSGLQKAAAESDQLAATVLRIERQIVASLMRIEQAARASLGKTVAAFVTGEAKIGEASTEIAADAAKVGASMAKMGVDSEKGAAKMAASTAVVKKSASGIGDAINSGAGGAGKPLNELGARFDALGERVRGSVLNIQNALLGLGALRFGQEAVGAASEFEAALGQVQIVAGDSGKSIEELRGFLLDLSKTTPVGLVDLTKSLGDAIGKLPKGANQAAVAIDALNAAQAAARASGSSAGQVLDGIIPILNTYGKTGITAAEITDKLFAAFDQGGATVPELSASLGQVVGISAQFGISIDELLGSIAVLTRGGQTASEAITNLRQAFISTARPPENVRKELEKLGLSAELFSAQSLKSNGLIGVLEQLQAKGGATQLEKLFTDTQGFLGVSTLLGAGLTQVREDIDLIGQSSGKTDAAVGVIAQNFDQLAGIAKNRLGAVLIDIGERIMPTVARVLGQLADYAEKNGPQIAEGIGKAVDALASFGEFIVSYGPEILTFLAAVKGTSWFVGLANDIAAAGLALRTFSQGLAASDALGKGLSSLGAQGGESFLGGMKSTLKGAGGVVKSALQSPGMAAAIAGAFTIGYEIGSALMDALGDAIEEGTQRQIRGAIDALDAEISGRLKDIGARSVEEASSIRRSLTSGQAVQTEPGRVQTLAEVQQGGGDVQAAFNAGLTAIAQEVQKAQAATARNVAASAQAAAYVEELQRRQISGAELEAAQRAFEQQQAAVQASAKRVADLTDGSKSLVDQYATVTKNAATLTQTAGAAGIKAAAGAKSAMQSAAKGAESDLERIAQEVIDLYKREAEKLADLRAQQAQLTSEAATNEVEARRAAFDAETQAHEAMLTDINASEEQLARYRRDREKELVSLVEDQGAAIRQAADVRIDEAKRAADAEAAAFAGSAEIQRQIAENLTKQVEIINADATARISELRISAANRVAAAERDLAAKTADTLQKQIQGALDQTRAAFSDPGAFQPMQPGAEAAGPIAGAASDIGGIGGGAVGGAIAILPAINEVAGAGANFFGGDVAGLREQARAKDREAAQAEARIAAGGLSDEEKTALQERADAARAEADAFRKAAQDAKGGLETFFEDLFTNLERFFTGWLLGLPQAIDRIVNELLPAFVEKVIANLPKIILGFVTLAPRIAFAIIKAIAISLPQAIYRGFKDAGAQIVELLTSDIAQAIINAVMMAFDVAVNALQSGIEAIFTPIIDFFADIFDAAGGLFSGDDSTSGRIGRSLGLSAGAKILSGDFEDLSAKDIPIIGGLLHQGGTVSASQSDAHSAGMMAAAGAPRFADGGMVRRLNSLARRRMSQVLSGDDVPALLSPGEGVLTQQGVAAVGGPGSLAAINRGNAPAVGGGQVGAELTLSARIGGDRALAAFISRIVSVSMSTPGGAVRTAIDASNRATSYPGVSWVR